MHADVLHGVEGSVVRDGLGGPERAQQTNGLVGPAPPLGDRDATGSKLRGVLAADPDAQDQPTAGGPIEVGDLLRHDCRLVQGQQQDRRADLDPLRHGGKTGEVHHRLGRRIVRGDVAARPERVDGELFHRRRLLRVAAGDEADLDIAHQRMLTPRNGSRARRARRARGPRGSSPPTARRGEVCRATSTRVST